MSEENVGYYIVSVEVGHVGMPGAPILHLDLGVNATNGQVTGRAAITQALPPPFGETVIPHVTGHIHHTGFGQDTLLVHMSGEYGIPFPPPQIGERQAHFSASLAVDKAWNGTGSFTYGGHTIANVPAKNVSPK